MFAPAERSKHHSVVADAGLPSFRRSPNPCRLELAARIVLTGLLRHGALRHFLDTREERIAAVGIAGRREEGRPVRRVGGENAVRHRLHRRLGIGDAGRLAVALQSGGVDVHALHRRLVVR